MTIARDNWAVVRRLLGILALVGAGIGYLWLATYKEHGKSELDSQQLLLLFFSPAAFGIGIYWIAGLWRGALAAATEYELLDDQLIVRRPFCTSSIRWDSIDDFQLPPAPFPAPPRTLILLHNARQVKLPLRRLSSAEAMAKLQASVPALSAHGIENARPEPAQSLSSMKVRWRLYDDEIPAIFASLIFFVLFGLGSLALSWDFANYWRIQRHHYSAAATVTQISVDNGKEKSVWARVRYATWDGRQERLHREVALSFADSVKVGDQVTVDYVPSHPSIGRIRNWDLDGREWVWLIFALPIVLASFRRLGIGLGRWSGALHEQLFWGGIAPSQECVIFPANLDELSQIAPARHEGALVLKPPKGNHKPTPEGVVRRLKNAGLEALEVLRKFVVVGPGESRRLLARMGANETYKGGYIVLDCDSARKAERLLLDASKADAVAEARLLQATHLHYLDQTIGPMSEAEAVTLFEDWLLQRLRRLYGGALPPKIPAPHCVGLFNFNPAGEGCLLLIVRAKSGPQIWMRKLDESFASRATCERGKWTLQRNLRAPRRMARMRKMPFYKAMRARIRSAGSPMSVA